MEYGKVHLENSAEQMLHKLSFFSNINIINLDLQKNFAYMCGNISICWEFDTVPTHFCHDVFPEHNNFLSTVLYPTWITGKYSWGYFLSKFFCYWIRYSWPENKVVNYCSFVDASATYVMVTWAQQSSFILQYPVHTI